MRRTGEMKLVVLIAREHLDQLRATIKEVPEPMQIDRARHHAGV